MIKRDGMLFVNICGQNPDLNVGFIIGGWIY